MATIVQRGKGVVAGVTGTVNVFVWPIQQKLDFTQEWDEELLKDVNGFTMAAIGRDEKIVGDIGLKFVADSNADAAVPMSTGAGVLSNFGQPMLSPYQNIILSGFKMAALNGTWQNISGTKLDQENTKVADGTYKLRAWADSTQNTLMTTTPS
jgi:hypothetical protein